MISSPASDERPGRRLWRTLPLGLLALAWFLGTRESTVRGLLGLAEGSDEAHTLHLALQTLLWIAATGVVIQFVRTIVYDRVVAHAIGGPVPGVLKALTALLIWLLAATLVVGLVFGNSITAFLAALGAGSIVLGIGLRGLVADVFTGLAINMDRSFTIGDWVQIDAGISGLVIGQIDEIGWRCTTLTTEEKTRVVVPNGLLGAERMTNITRPLESTRFETTITVEFSVPAERVKRVALSAMRALEDEPGFDHQKKPAVLVKETGALGVEYLLRYWIRPWDPVSPTTAQDRVMSNVLHHFRIAGIALAYPKRDVYQADMPVRQIDGHNLEDLVLLLGNVRIFRPLSVADVKEVAEGLQRHHYGEGDTLVREGDKGKSLFILIEGLLDVFMDRDGQPRRVGRIHPGECFGEMSLLTGERRSATVRATCDSIVYEVDRKSIRHVMERRPALTETLSQLLAEHQLGRELALESEGENPRVDQLESFAHQIMNRMRDFLDLHRGTSKPD